ncbi:predicted protein [Verticillium alfalfae VaMs.102]|uniref:Predicted protein n=1 Tax=Verticillium alfalfae (strain VaMs.102 / ATCC MYA-4576 / FGSC 10136) TaxID=526221 RepID=C9SHF6_VERA1|nr:predicted protein [Verticillium alfalfae VaMs.102]EEY18379.1 predicted protein [Verticillium alfalfae VaMs.102]
MARMDCPKIGGCREPELLSSARFAGLNMGLNVVSGPGPTVSHTARHWLPPSRVRAATSHTHLIDSTTGQASRSFITTRAEPTRCEPIATSAKRVDRLYQSPGVESWEVSPIAVALFYLASPTIRSTTLNNSVPSNAHRQMPRWQPPSELG